MKDEDKRRRYLFVLVFLTSMLLVTTSYAWFTTSRVVTINTLNLHVAAEGGLEISSDAVNWKSVLDISDLELAREKYPNSKNQIPMWLSPMSSGGNVENGALMLYHGQASNDTGDNFILTTSRGTEEEGFGEDSNGRFVAFDIFLRTPADKTLYLTSSAGVSYNGIENTGIENAFRIAFLNEGTRPKDDSLASIQNMNGATSSSIWEPNYDVHTEGGVKNALDVYGISTTKTGGSLLPYDGVISELITNDGVTIDKANSTNYPQYFKKVKVDYATVANFTDYKELFVLKAGVTKLRIYIWIEGQDVDCENEASVGDVIVNLQISTNPA